MKISNVMKGWGKHLTGAALTDKEKERAKICEACPFKRYSKSIAHFDGDDIIEIKGMLCDKCKCYLPAKIRVPKEKCPLNKW